MKPLLIVGAGGHGREALDIVEAINQVEPTWQVLGFLDDGREVGSYASPHELPVIGGVAAARNIDAAVVVAVGHPAARRSIVRRLGDFESPTLVHPQASLGSHVSHGQGLIVAQGACITHGVELGSHVHLNVASSVSHDCRIGSFVTVTPGARLSGGVVLGDDIWLGINSCVIQGVNVADGVTVGAGAAVVNDLPAGVTAVGVPARPLEEE